ncbi:MAG: potassium/proton antiporter [Bacteroidota bacterium]
MDFTVETILIIGSFLLFVSILASKISTRLGIPTLLIFLAIGMLAGSDGIGGINFENLQTAKTLGAITITLILFFGGLDTEFDHIKPIIWNGVLLSTIGVLVTAFSIGYVIYWATNLTLSESLLMGSIVSSTDAAAVFSILRSSNIRLKHNLAPTLELESGSNDVMAYFLMLFFMSTITKGGDISLMAAIPMFFQEMLIGGIVGLLIGKAMLLIVNKAKIANEALYPALTLSMILFTYSATNYIHGSGFLAVYIAAIMLGSQNFLHKNSLIKFYDGVIWLMQVVMFIVLGLLVSPKKLLPIAGSGFLISLALMFVARPLGVFLALIPARKVDNKQKLFISWVGLRGAVPIVFATYPMLAGIDQSETIFHIIFFIVLTSILLQGTTLQPLAQWLKLEEKISKKKAQAISLSEDVRSVLLELEVTKAATAVGKKIFELGFPKGSLIVLISRKNQYMTPRGDTTIEAGDKLLIMTDDKRAVEEMKTSLGIA